MAILKICDIYRNLRVVTNVQFREIKGIEISAFNMYRLGLFIKRKIVLDPTERSVDNLQSLMIKTPKGSNIYRKILA